MKTVLAVVAVLAAAGTAKADPTDLDPPSFASSRSGTPVVMLPLLQDECTSGTFADAINDGYVGTFNLSVFNETESWSPSERCPSYTDGVSGYDFPQPAFNGVVFTGTNYYVDGRDVEESLVSELDATGIASAFDVSSSFTLDFWILPNSDITTSGKNFLLFELGKKLADAGKVPGDDYDWTAVDGDYVFQLLYEPDGPRFLFKFRVEDEFGSSAFERTITSSNFAMEADTLYYLTFSRYFNSGDPSSTYHVSLTEAGVGTTYVASERYYNFDAGLTDMFVRIGSSPETLTGNSDYDNTASWPGSILYFSVLTPSLVSDAGPYPSTSPVYPGIPINFAAGMPNSKPVMTTTTGATATVDEDADLVDSVINPSDIVFDFDTLWFSAAAPQFILTGYDLGAGRLGASVTADGVSVDLDADLPITVTSAITYNADDNAYGTDTTLTFSATDTYGTAPNTATVAMIVDPINDDPEALESSTWATYTSQSTYSVLTLRGRDIDCLVGTAEEPYLENSCDAFGRQKTFTVFDPNATDSAASTLGRLYEPDGTSCAGGLALAITEGRDIDVGSAYTQVVDLAGTYGTTLITLCFEACLGVEPDGYVYNVADNFCPPELNNASSLGNAYFAFTVTDEDGATSNTVLISTAVTSVLDANVGSLEVVVEDEVSAITLSGIDNYCEQDPEPADCPTRTMTFALSELIPPTQGTLYLDANLSSPLEIGEIFDGTMYLKPALDYYSVDSWPLCSSGTGYSMSLCPDENIALSPANAYPFPCTGPLCGSAPIAPTAPSGSTTGGRYVSFTTTDLASETMGVDANAGCVAGDAAGCPITINYKILIESESLESVPAPGMDVYVQNVNDAPSLDIPVKSLADITKNVYYDFADGDGNPIQVTDKEANTRVIDVVVQVTDTAEGRLVMGEDLTLDSNLIEFKRGAGVVSSGTPDLRMTGIQSEINRVLAVLQYRSTGGSTLTDTIIITVQDTTRNSILTNDYTAFDGVTYYSMYDTIDITIKETDSGSGVRLTLPTLAIYGIIGGGSLCCIGFCVGLVCAIASCAQRGNRTARWILHNVLCSTLQPGGDPSELEHEMQSAAHFTEAAVHAEHARLHQVVWCAKFMHMVCPCCVKFAASDKMIPDEESMMVAVTDRLRHERASQHLPSGAREKSVRLIVMPEELFNWERHMHFDEATGRNIPYYFNSKTNESSWHRPKVRDQTDPPDEV